MPRLRFCPSARPFEKTSTSFTTCTYLQPPNTVLKCGVTSQIHLRRSGVAARCNPAQLWLGPLATRPVEPTRPPNTVRSHPHLDAEPSATSIARGRRSARASNQFRANSPAQTQPFVYFGSYNPSRINTSMKSSFFIKSLIMNDLKSIRIRTGDNKTFTINTSENYCWKPFSINTSKEHPGEGGGYRHPVAHFRRSPHATRHSPLPHPPCRARRHLLA